MEPTEMSVTVVCRGMTDVPTLISTSAPLVAVAYRGAALGLPLADMISGGTPSDTVRGAIVDTVRQAAIARAYESLPMFDADAVAAFDAMATETMRQLDALTAAGLTVSVVETDPYGSAREMFEDVARGRISVLSTRSTGGHPYFSDDVNDAFRAVHDVVGHAATGRGFDRHGEEAAYRSHASMFSSLAALAMATETRGQNASLIARGNFSAGQRVAILPQWARRGDALVPLTAPDALAALAQARKFHAAAGLAAV